MSLNPEKTKVALFNLRISSTSFLNLDGSIIKHTDHTPYLGLPIGSSIDYRSRLLISHVERKISVSYTRIVKTKLRFNHPSTTPQPFQICFTLLLSENVLQLQIKSPYDQSSSDLLSIFYICLLGQKTVKLSIHLSSQTQILVLMNLYPVFKEIFITRGRQFIRNSSFVLM